MSGSVGLRRALPVVACDPPHGAEAGDPTDPLAIEQPYEEAVGAAHALRVGKSREVLSFGCGLFVTFGKACADQHRMALTCLWVVVG